MEFSEAPGLAFDVSHAVIRLILVVTIRCLDVDEERKSLKSRMMASKYQVGALALVLLMLFMSSCVPLPTDPRWASVTLIDGGQEIMFAFHDKVALVDPVDGSPIELRDSEGRTNAHNGQNGCREQKCLAESGLLYHTISFLKGS